jgi:TraM recognition site of TraD and TraG
MPSQSFINTDKIRDDIMNTPILRDFKNVTRVDVLPWLLYFVVGVFGLILVGLILFSILVNLLALIERKTKKNYQLQISYDQFTNFHEGYNSIMINFLKGLRASIKGSIINLEVKKVGGQIHFSLYANDLGLLKSLQTNLNSIEGINTELVESKSDQSKTSNKKSKLFLQTIHSSQSRQPIHFNESNSLSQVIQTLENIQNTQNDNNTQATSGVLITFRATDQLYKMQGKIQRFQQLQGNEKSRHKHFYQTRINQLEEKSKHGDLFIVKLYSFSTSKATTSAISNSLASSFSNQKAKIHSKLFNPFSPFQSALKILQNKYLFGDTPWFANFPRRYNYMNSLELAHYFFPNFTPQQLDLKPNLVEIVSHSGAKINDSKIGAKKSKPKSIDKSIQPNDFKNTTTQLFKFNDLGDDLDFSKGKLNKLCFGDPDSGKSSAYMASELQAAFGFGVGIVSTIYKQEEADLLIHLAIKNKRNKDLIVLSKAGTYKDKQKRTRVTKATKWQTNIAESQLKASLSIKNIINLFEVINKAVEGSKAGGGNQDPFWERSNNELQNAIIRLMLVCDGKFSISRMIELSNLASDYASEKATKLGNIGKNNSVETGKFEILLASAKAKLVVDKTKKMPSIKLYNQTLDAGQIADFRSGIDYFETVFVNIPEKQRDSLLTVYRSILNYCNSGIIRDKLFADVTPASPNWFDFESTRSGKIIVLDVPKESTGTEGQYFQIIAKIAWQQSMLRSKGRDVYFISDEFQEFASSGDSKFLSANRSYGVHHVLATQNYKGLELVLGKVGTDDLLEKCQTKLFFKTSAIDTIDYAQKLIGEDLHYSSSQSLGGVFSSSTTDNVRSQLLPRHFQALSASVPANQAQCIIFSQGRIWKQTKKPFLSVVFSKIDRFEPVDLVKVSPEQFKNAVKKGGKKKAIERTDIVSLGAANTNSENAKSNAKSDKKGSVKTKSIELVKSEIGNIKVIDVKKLATKKGVLKVKSESKKAQVLAPEIEKPAEVFLTIKEVTQQFPIEKTKLYRLIGAENFRTIDGKLHKGKPIKLISKLDLELYFLKQKSEVNLEILKVNLESKEVNLEIS